jgi:hypothetical protein
MSSKRWFMRFVLLAALVVVPAAALAQSESSIAGEVTDVTGGVLPGATVEVASPALIEQLRTAVTDGQGIYRIVGLRPGVYSVTFMLPGFSRVVREGIELTGSFTATVNAELVVGTLEETVTVTGASPVVDVQNIVQRQILSREIIDNAATAKVMHQMAALLPAARLPLRDMDVGGSRGETLGSSVTVHGSRNVDMMLQMDGMRYNGVSMSGGGGHGIHVNAGAAQEIVLETGGVSAEHELGGLRTNVIPKEGGNRYTGYFSTSFANSGMQSNNLSQRLQDRGLLITNNVDKIWDVNPGFGGPLVRDKLWFYVSGRAWGSHNALAGVFRDSDLSDFAFTPDLNRQALSENTSGSESVRFTWQVNERNKLNLHWEYGQHCDCQLGLGPTNVWAATKTYNYNPNYIAQASWTFPVTNRLLIEAGATRVLIDYSNVQQAGIDREAVSARELSTGIRFRAPSSEKHPKNRNKNFHTRFSMTYVTGSHALKVGLTTVRGRRDRQADRNGDATYFLRNGVPESLTLYATPYKYSERLNLNYGMFVQDQWTIDRMTLNLGLRYDALHASVPDQDIIATRFVPARTYDEIDDVPNWKDVSPRVGFAYDLFGDGRTALKAHIGHYVVGRQLNFTARVHPARAIVSSVNRTWSDDNGNFVPDGDLTDSAANGELGPYSSLLFGTDRVATQYKEGLLTGSGKREGNWEASVGVQHELAPGLSVNVSYHRRWYHGLVSTDNILVGPADYDPFCVTGPSDSRLPGGGGEEICGLFDISQDKFGQVDNVITRSEEFGDRAEVFDGIDVTADGRLPNGLLVTGGVSFGRVRFDDCFVVDSPDQRFCDSAADKFSTPRIKFIAVYPLPWQDLQLSLTGQSVTGAPITAAWSAPNSEIEPSLGRPHNSGRATVQLIEPGTEFDSRVNQFDIRISKRFIVGGARIQGMFDIYNAFNADAILSLNTRFGSQWLRPTAVLNGRLLKVGMQLDF